MTKIIVPSLRYRYTDNGYVPANDISAAEAFGPLFYLTEPGNYPITQPVIDQVINRMNNVEKDDIILLVGDMLLCAIAIGEMAAQFDKVRVLRWHNKFSEYVIEEWEWSLYDDHEEPAQVG